MRNSLKTSLILVAMALTLGAADATAIAAQTPTWTTTIVRLNSKTLPKNQGAKTIKAQYQSQVRLPGNHCAPGVTKCGADYRLVEKSLTYHFGYIPTATTVAGGTNGIGLRLTIKAKDFRGVIFPTPGARVAKGEDTSWLNKSFSMTERYFHGLYFRQVEANVWVAQTWDGFGGKTTLMNYIARTNNGFDEFSQQMAAKWSSKKYAPNKMLLDIAEHLSGRIPIGVTTSAQEF